MRKRRVGNDFFQTFQIKENGETVDLISVRDTIKIFAKVNERCFQIPKELISVLEGGLITLEVKTELFCEIGRYEIIVKYEHYDLTMSDEDRRQATNFTAFAIVGKTELADELEDIPIVSDILIGLKGDKMKFSDLTEAEKLELKGDKGEDSDFSSLEGTVEYNELTII